MPDNLTLGLLPERKNNWRNFAASYGIEIVLILFLLGARLIFPDSLQFRPTQVTELIPPPAPEPVKIETSKVVPAPVRLPAPITTPRLVVPKEVIAQAKKDTGTTENHSGIETTAVGAGTSAGAKGRLHRVLWQLGSGDCEPASAESADWRIRGS